MQCKVVSAGESKTFENVLSVTFSGAREGEIEILPKHAESFIALNDGTMILEKAQGGRLTVELGGGLCFVKDDSVFVIL